jgi:hypothetical protein
MTAATSMSPEQSVQAPLALDACRIERHELSLLLGGRCRACAEMLPQGALLRGHPCPMCHEATTFEERDRAVIIEFLAQRANVRVGMLALAIGLSHLIVGWVPVASSLIIAASTAWIRLQIVQPATRLLTPRRARVAVWTARIGTSAFVAATLIFNELLTMLPFVGTIVKGLLAAGEVLLVSWGNARYMRWQIERDEDGLAVGWWEYGLLACSFGLLVASAIGLVAAAVAVVVFAQAAADRLIQ